MKKSSLVLSVLASVAGLGFAGGALAQSTWNWGSSPGCDPYTCSVGGVTATVSGWGAETSTSAFVAGQVNDVDPSGLGVKSKDASGSLENGSSPNHSIDNFKAFDSTYSSTSDSTTGGAAYAEVLAINFSQAVDLTQVAVAWTYTDSDAMIFRWDGGSAPAALSTFTANQLPTSTGATSNGWTLVSSGQFSSSSNQLNMSGGFYSSYWLVSTALGQTSASANNDGFKVNSFSGSVCAYTVTNGSCTPPGGEVAEPASLALAGLALVGMAASRRRRTVVQAA